MELWNVETSSKQAMSSVLGGFLLCCRWVSSAFKFVFQVLVDRSLEFAYPNMMECEEITAASRNFCVFCVF